MKPSSFPARLPGALVLPIAAFLASGCSGAAPEPGAARTAAAVVAASTGATCTSTDAHAAHQAAGIACVTCHPCGGKFGFTSVFTFPGGTSTAGGTITVATSTTPTSCAVACHYPLGSPAGTVTWTAPAPLACTSCHDAATILAHDPQHPTIDPSYTRAQCQLCHDTSAHTSGTVRLVGHDASWVDTTSPGFHAFAANRDLTACERCHLPDLTGGLTNVACAKCHDVGLPAGVASWKVNCTMCHGGTDNQTGAPPRATWGNAGDPTHGGGTADPVRVGAHTSHLAGSAIAPAFGCGVCHVKPADALAPGHVDQSTATVTFAGLATNGVTAPAWDRTAGTCSNTYCHGGSIGGGSNPTPVWTLVGAGQADCGTCHGLPPQGLHPPVSPTLGLTACFSCHPLTIDQTGALIPPAAGGKHLNGFVESSGHGAAWMDTTSSTFHAFSADRSIRSCTTCHGADLSGGNVNVGCGNCHDKSLPAGVASWKVNCTMCHGGVDNQTGAPPAATWGNAGDPARGGGTADPIRVGAHTKHVTSTLTRPIDCSACHLKPADALSTGHIDSSDAIATVTWGGLAVAGGANPAWDRTTGNCSATYCHGNYSGTFSYNVWDWGLDASVTQYYSYVGIKATPGWTSGPMTCGSCHGNPPAGGNTWHSGHHGYSGVDSYNECQNCHPDAISVNGVGVAITNAALHVNGAVDVTPQWTSKCFGCH